MTQTRVSPLGEERGADSRLDDTLVGLASRSIPDEDSQELIPGSKVGRYVVLEQIGRGGMGVVLGAFDPQLNRKIALKLLHAHRNRESSTSSGAGRHRLLREAQAIAKLSHPNVISVYDVGTMGDSIYVAMEFVEGCTLTVWLEQQKRRPLEIVEMFLQAGRGLAAAHAAGLVHRDFKPDNVLVGSDGLVRVSDFGLARADPTQLADVALAAGEAELDSAEVRYTVDLDDSDVLSSPLTQTGVVVGTPRYMAPEQHAGAPADARSDQFAFCVALYQALYGQDPFVANTLERLALAKQEGRVCEIPAQSRVPAYLEDIVMRGLAPESADRFASMEDLVAALERDPAAWRHRLLLGAIGIVVAASVAAGIRFQPEEAQPACQRQAHDDWRDIWDAERRSALQARFEAPHEVVWTGFQAEVDAYTGQWTQMRIAACESIRGRPEPGLVELQLRCLGRQQEAVARMLTVVAEAGAADLAKVGRVLSVMPELEHCDSREFLLALPAPPRDEAVARQTKDVQARLDRVLPLAALGHLEEAAALAREATQDAEASDYPPSRAEAHYVYGRSLVASGALWDAEAELGQAIWAATRTKHDAFAAPSARTLVEVTGTQLGRHREGVLWEEFTRSYLGRLGLEGLEVAKLDAAAGRLALRMGDVDRARTYVERAIAVRETVRGVHDRDLARWWVDLGDVALAGGDLTTAREHYTKAAEVIARSSDPRHPTSGLAAWGLGRLALEAEDFAAARVHCERALELLSGELSAGDPAWVATIIDLARAQLETGSLGEAETRLEEVLALDAGIMARPHVLGVRARIVLAAAALRQEDWNAAGVHLTEARHVLRQLPRVDTDVVASLHRSEGELRLALGQHDAAVHSMNEALSMWLQAADEFPKQIALARFDLARATWIRGPALSVLEQAERARAELETVAPHAKVSLGAMDQWLSGVEKKGR